MFLEQLLQRKCGCRNNKRGLRAASSLNSSLESKFIEKTDVKFDAEIIATPGLQQTLLDRSANEVVSMADNNDNSPGYHIAAQVSAVTNTTHTRVTSHLCPSFRIKLPFLRLAVRPAGSEVHFQTGTLCTDTDGRKQTVYLFMKARGDLSCRQSTWVGIHNILGL